MKFSCESCGAQYMIADEKIGQKGVKVRCKKCGFVIIVRPLAAVGAAALAKPPPPPDPTGAISLATTFGDTATGDDEDATKALSKAEQDRELARMQAPDTYSTSEIPQLSLSGLDSGILVPSEVKASPFDGAGNGGSLGALTPPPTPAEEPKGWTERTDVGPSSAAGDDEAAALRSLAGAVPATLFADDEAAAPPTQVAENPNLLAGLGDEDEPLGPPADRAPTPLPPPPSEARAERFAPEDLASEQTTRRLEVNPVDLQIQLPNVSVPAPTNGANGAHSDPPASGAARPSVSRMSSTLALTGAGGAAAADALAQAAQGISLEEEIGSALDAVFGTYPEAGDPFESLVHGADSALKGMSSKVATMPPATAEAPEPPNATKVFDAVAMRRVHEEQDLAGGDKAAGPVWYVAIQDSQVGPLGFDELKAKFDAHQIDLHSLCWKQGMGDWIEIRFVKELEGLVGLGDEPTRVDRAEVAPARAEARAEAPRAGEGEEARARNGHARAAAEAPKAPPPPVAPPPPEDDDDGWAPSAASALASLAAEELAGKPSAARADSGISNLPRAAARAAGTDLSSVLGAESSPSLPAARPSGAPRFDAEISEVRPLPKAAPEPFVLRESSAPKRNLYLAIGGGAFALLVVVLLIANLVRDPPPPPAPPEPAKTAAVTPPPAAPAPAVPTPPPAPAAAPVEPVAAAAAVEAAPPKPPEPAAVEAPKPEEPKRVAKRDRPKVERRREPAPEPEPAPPPPPKTKEQLDPEDLLAGAGKKKKSGGGSDLPARLDDAEILRVMRQGKDSVRACIDKQAAADPDLEGVVRMKFVILGTGKTSQHSVEPAKFRSAVIGKCLTDAVKGWSFPRFSGGPEPVDFPVTLKGR